MRRTITLSLSAAAIVAAAWVSVQPAEAAARYCLQGRQWGYPGNCAFATYRQCRATTSGTAATCGLNPSYAYARHRRQ